MTPVRSRCWRALPWLGALFAFWLAAATSAQEVDPPGRVATLSFRQGSVVFAPQGEQDWIELPANRPLTSGDRIWSDQDARASRKTKTFARMMVQGFDACLLYTSPSPRD